VNCARNEQTQQSAEHEKIQPVEQHHVAHFGVECKRNTTQVTSETYHMTLRTTDTHTHTQIYTHTDTTHRQQCMSISAVDTPVTDQQ